MLAAAMVGVIPGSPCSPRCSPITTEKDMPDFMPASADPLTMATQIAATGPISLAGRWAFRGAAAAVAVAGISPTARPAAIRAALARLADDDPTTAVHGLAALLRAERDAAIQASRSWAGHR
jgi:hypothetical protein